MFLRIFCLEKQQKGRTFVCIQTKLLKKASVMEEYIAPNRKRIPYGMMNFAVIRRDDCYYVDKTRFIPIIEDADKFFSSSSVPSRFGKSLTVSMLQHYYDIAAKDKFDALFGDLYIGKYPTRDRNSYPGALSQFFRNCR